MCLHDIYYHHLIVQSISIQLLSGCRAVGTNKATHASIKQSRIRTRSAQNLAQTLQHRHARTEGPLSALVFDNGNAGSKADDPWNAQARTAHLQLLQAVTSHLDGMSGNSDEALLALKRHLESA